MNERITCRGLGQGLVGRLRGGGVRLAYRWGGNKRGRERERRVSSFAPASQLQSSTNHHEALNKRMCTSCSDPKI